MPRMAVTSKVRSAEKPKFVYGVNRVIMVADQPKTKTIDCCFVMKIRQSIAVTKFSILCVHVYWLSLLYTSNE